ncbi:ABC transporter releated protein [Methanocaldococcus villosus KIN24-T80]|uniref:ABC transporter releated protein n=1 Tax=Methanocaldococcus villosus KIN24-T80 TaxID=1069083 RepID=N6VP29_9EURY|nr:ABC transporter ATP-binding protein [Methanocaldococcus villosus]ENN95595.1 ABC transporter releated protein [Methanocaldococcus villosus KIN24-T80]
MEIFKLKEVSYSYGKNCVLEDINMEIYKNEILVILGPNGAGKTTLLKIIDGLIFPKKGEIYFKNIKITESLLHSKEFVREFRSKVGFVFQNPDLMLFNPTVWDEVLYTPLQIYDKEKAIKMAEKALKKLKIYHLKDRHPYNLSGGEKKKVAISSILSSDPEVILMDEPTASLDPKSRNELIDIILDLKKEGKTIIIVTHDLSLASLADRCYIINKRILFEGKVKDMFNLPLEEWNLDVPDITKLFLKLREMGYDVDIPINLKEALNIITKLINL